MLAAILSIGDELTTGLTVDANALWLSAELERLGFTVMQHRTVADDRPGIAQAIFELSQQCDVLIATGGLGPTPDDVSREALGDVVSPGEPLIEDEQALQQLLAWFARHQRSMPEVNRRQVMRPPPTAMIENTQGTAPGLIAASETSRIFLLPGVPREMRAMFDRSVRHMLPPTTRPGRMVRQVHCQGLGESSVAERLGALLARDHVPQIGTSANESMVTVRIFGVDTQHQDSPAVEALLSQIESRLHPYAFARDGASLPAAVGELLRERSLRIAVAESCTGGLLGSMLSVTPGSSAYLLGGWITYSNDMKAEQLGVSHDTLRMHGAVSAPVVEGMLRGAIDRSGAEVALAVSGIAGPDGGSDEKPVGTVFIGCGMKESSSSAALDIRRFHFPGPREAVRERAARSALQMARFRLLGVADETVLLNQVLDSVHHRQGSAG